MLLVEELRTPTNTVAEALILVAQNYGVMVWPQALAILAACFMPRLRGRFLQVFLVPTTLVLLAFQAFMTLGSDPNRGMLFGLYPIVPMVMLIVAFVATPGRPRATKS
jgi:hypothetical protein